MKVFLDTADVEAIRRANDTGLLDGVTTNPMKIAETGKPFYAVIEEICSIVSGPVSAEAVAHSAEDIVREAEKLAAIAPNVVNKVPMSLAGLKAAATLEQEKDIRVNVTMVFSADQALLAMKTGAAFVSIVLSRLDKIGSESEILVDDTVTVKENYGFTSEILAASLKTRNHVLSCLRHGADIISVPESLFFEMFHHPLTDQALAEFDEVWRKVIK
ncbi:MAG: fructose-6-phosphate aldolase [Deltaproteobacteria bacterium]|jgi:transaldolase|nr:fructose-6-phosphate aldolase [Deltaproteobacteria bacterium]